MVLKLISDDRARDPMGRIWVRGAGRRWSEASVQPVEVTRRRAVAAPRRLAAAASSRAH